MAGYIDDLDVVKLEAYVERLEALYRRAESATWEFARALAASRDELGESYYGVISLLSSRIGVKAYTLERYASAASAAIEGGYLDERLSLAHHIAVQRQGLPVEARRAYLQVAAERGLSAGDLAAAIRQAELETNASGGESDEGGPTGGEAGPYIVDNPDWLQVVGERVRIELYDGAVYARFGEYLLFIASVDE